MDEYTYINLRTRASSGDIGLLFPDWERGGERLAVFGPHDDDPLLGAGYAMAAALDSGAEVFVVIFCKGDCGYSSPEQKDSIVGVRRTENERALARFGVKKENIFRFEYPDFSLCQFVGKTLQSGEDGGALLGVIDFIRNNGITRAMIPNGYREHVDHTAAYNITAFDIIQAGDAVVADRGAVQLVKSFLQYSVWADFSQEDALLSGEKDISIRANRAIVCPEAVEERVRAAVGEYVSQKGIITDLLLSREERRVPDSNKYMELYIELDPRPKLDFAPYARLIGSII